MSKDDLHQLIAADELEKLAAALLAWATESGANELYSDALIEAGRLASLKKSSVRGATSEVDLMLQRNNIRIALVELVEHLPDSPTATASLQPAGMTENRFKLLVFITMVIGNIAAFICLFILGEGAGGFKPEETSMTAALLISVSAAYFSVMLGEYISKRNAPQTKVEPRVSQQFLWISMSLLVLYFISVCWLINYRPMLEFKSFINWLTAFESGLGLFVGQIVHSLFKKHE